MLIVNWRFNSICFSSKKTMEIFECLINTLSRSSTRWVETILRMNISYSFIIWNERSIIVSSFNNDELSEINSITWISNYARGWRVKIRTDQFQVKRAKKIFIIVNLNDDHLSKMIWSYGENPIDSIVEYFDDWTQLKEFVEQLFVGEENWSSLDQIDQFEIDDKRILE